MPTLLVLWLVWLPAVGSVLLSFTNWDGIGPLSVGQVRRAEELPATSSTIYPPFWPAVQHNLIWLGVMFLIATPLGMFLAVLLDRELRGSRIYQTAIYLPVVLSLALVGFIWQLIYSRDQGLINQVDRQHASTGTATSGTTSGRRWSPRAGGTSATSCCSTWPA